MLDLQPPDPEGMDAGAFDAGVPMACSSDDNCPDDGNVCNGIQVCDPSSGLCVSWSGPSCGTATPCMDAACDPQLGCIEVPRECPDDGIDCTVEVCDPIQNSCVRRPDSSLCPADGLCSTSLCRLDSGCETEDLCENLQPGAFCSGDSCVLPEPCNNDGDCRPVAPCLTASCEDGLCTQRPADADAMCRADECSYGSCQDGVCVPGPVPIDCGTSGNPCVARSCDPVQGCRDDVLDGVACDADGSPCTPDQCVGSVCTGRASSCPVDDPDDCFVPQCQPDGTCPLGVLTGTRCMTPMGDCGRCDIMGSGRCDPDPMCGSCGPGLTPCGGAGGGMDCCEATEFCLPGPGICQRRFDCATITCSAGLDCCPCNGPSPCVPLGTPCVACMAI